MLKWIRGKQMGAAYEGQNTQYPNYKMTPQVVIDMARKFLRDTPKLNELRGIEETDESVFKLAINMAISDWNSTPPLLAPVGLEDFPSFDWLIISTAMFVLMSAGVLQYRNELQYTDQGITVNPWSKGPAYISLAGMWANMCDVKKREYKYALNISRTFGIARTSEYLMWDYSGLYTGVPGDNVRGTGPSSVAAGILGTNQPSVGPYAEPHKRIYINFTIDQWVGDGSSATWTMVLYHNFGSDVDLRLTDPLTGEDLRSKANIFFGTTNAITLVVPMTPDGRFAAKAIVFKV